jgi:hypothetical protein
MPEQQPDALPREVLELLEKITPVDEHAKLVRYEHGGGRFYREVAYHRKLYAGGTDRELIADFYNEGDREFYSQAPRLVRGLLDLLAQQAGEIARLREALDDAMGL